MNQSTSSIPVRAIQLGERIDLKGLERDDAFSTDPLAFRTPTGGSVMLFKSGAAVFIGLTPIEEEDLIRGLGDRIVDPLESRENENAQLVVKPGDDELHPKLSIRAQAGSRERSRHRRLEPDRLAVAGLPELVHFAAGAVADPGDRARQFDVRNGDHARAARRQRGNAVTGAAHHAADQRWHEIHHHVP